MNNSKRRNINEEVEEIQGMIKDLADNIEKVETTGHAMELFSKLTELNDKLNILKGELENVGK